MENDTELVKLFKSMSNIMLKDKKAEVLSAFNNLPKPETEEQRKQYERLKEKKNLIDGIDNANSMDEIMSFLGKLNK